MEPIKKAIIFLSIALFISFSSFAQDSASITPPDPAYVNFLRIQDGQLFFTVKFLNPDGRRFDIVVNDSYGENLYQGNFGGKEFGKIFRAPVELGKLYVTIRPYGRKTGHKFEISSEARIVQETYVTTMTNRQ